ncbi:glycosyltransferase family 2 protein [Nocardia panacis]|uniref:Glycosyltransferase family 2 protein n=1 Tax=Nocardia panacis TaxID=2340916 RepID=A0A3A4KGN9_9NOCA|nr:glycosyltransferase family 2 protein [Nocardia panacis]RJO73428.1 glycosyltransferase family 2 protein [Nocardia panacis]
MSSRTRTAPGISVVIPAMNEERNLPHLAERMPRGLREIIVVDGNSADRTVAVARELWPAATIVGQTRRGKGNALACGFAVATGEIIVTLDADGSTDPAEIPDFADALLRGADYAKGSRFRDGGGSADITPLRRRGNDMLNRYANLSFGARFTDLCYGYNAFWRHCLHAMDLPPIGATRPQWGDGFEIETLMNVRVAKAGLTIAEVASFESERIHGVTNLNTFRDGLRVLSTIQQERGRSRGTAHPTGRAGLRPRPVRP